MKEMVVVLWFMFVPHHSEQVHIQAQIEQSLDACTADGNAAAPNFQASADAERIETFHGACTEMTQEDWDELKSMIDGPVDGKVGSL